MSKDYEYLRISVRPRSWPRVIAGVTAKGAEAIASAGGKLYAMWVSDIGLPYYHGVVLSTWAGDGGVNPVVQGVDDVLDASAERLEVVTGPRDSIPCTRNGIYMHRWFEMRDTDWKEFLDLSTDVWPDAEDAYGSKIIGFWRSRDAPAPMARALLITYYPNMAAWERSRSENARTPEEKATWRTLSRRHQLIESTVATTMKLAQSLTMESTTTEATAHA